jgi:hypothetical protein
LFFFFSFFSFSLLFDTWIQQNLCKLTFREQGVWFLNAFWEGGLAGGGGLADKGEDMWGFVEQMTKLDKINVTTGCELDEMECHRFLETVGEVCTVLALRSKLRKSGALAESDRPKDVPLTHFLLFKYEVSWNKLVNAPQGDNSAKIAEAQEKLQVGCGWWLVVVGGGWCCCG